MINYFPIQNLTTGSEQKALKQHLDLHVGKSSISEN